MKDLERELENDPEIKAAKRRLHMWMGMLATVFGVISTVFGFFLFSRFGFSPWETLKMGLPPLLGVMGFLGFVFALTTMMSRLSGKDRDQGEEHNR